MNEDKKMLNYILLLLETPTKAVGKWREPGTRAQGGWLQWVSSSGAEATALSQSSGVAKGTGVPQSSGPQWPLNGPEPI